MADKVNDEIVLATASPEEPEKQRIHVIRWNAMRELLDSGINFVTDTRKYRDEIMEIRRHMEQENQ